MKDEHNKPDSGGTPFQRNTGRVYTTRHTHNGVDTPKLNPLQSLNGFPIYTVTNAATAPTFPVTNGIPIFQVDSGPHYYIWVRLPNVSTGVNVWTKIQLT